MAWFSYKAVTTDGEVIEGELEALDRRAAIERLRSQGHVPIRAEERRGGRSVRRGGFRRRAGISSSAVALLTRELSMLLQSGRRLGNKGRLAVVVAPDSYARLIFEVAGMPHCLDVVETRAQAIALATAAA